MSLLLLLVVLAVIAGIAVVAAGRGTGLAPADTERSPQGALAPGEVGRDDVDGLRFTLALRGYRMDEVDAVLDRLLDELDRRDARIAELEGRPGTDLRDDDHHQDDRLDDDRHDRHDEPAEEPVDQRAARSGPADTSGSTTGSTTGSASAQEG